MDSQKKTDYITPGCGIVKVDYLRPGCGIVKVDYLRPGCGIQGGFEIIGGQTVTVFPITNLVPGPEKKYAAPENTPISNSCEKQLAYFLVGRALEQKWL